MAPMKRKSTSVGAGAKRSRGSVTTVVRTVVNEDSIPDNLRAALGAALPIALGAYKSDRHAYENEVVTQGGQALKAAGDALKARHQEALATQAEMIAPTEAKKRGAAKDAATGHLEKTKGELEECKANKKAAEKAVSEAEAALKSAKAEAKVAEKGLSNVAGKKAHLEDGLNSQLAYLLENNSSSSPGKKAVKQLGAIGREFGLGGTLLQTLPACCKKAPASRTEFEGMVFNQLRSLMEAQIGTHAGLVTTAEAEKAAKDGVVTDASGALDNAKAALKAAEDALDAKHTEQKDATKELHKADVHLRHIWEDMRKACDKQDALAGEVQNFDTVIMAAFNELKEHEAPPPEPEPVAEEAAAATEEAAAPAAES